HPSPPKTFPYTTLFRSISLTDGILKQHLEGEITIALYAINPSSQRCKWVAIDADYKDSMEDLLKLQYYLSEDKVEAALEMSKRRSEEHTSELQSPDHLV